MEIEEDSNFTDNGDNEEMRMKIILQRPTSSCGTIPELANPTAVFAIDDLESEFDPADAADVSEIDDDIILLPPFRYAIDLEISSVYKPRPMRKRFHHVHPGQHHHQNSPGRSMGKKGKKGKEKDKQHLHHNSHVQKDSSTINGDTSPPPNRTSLRRQARDRRREERKQTLLARAARVVVEGKDTNPGPANTSKLPKNAQTGAETLAEALEALHVHFEPNTSLEAHNGVITSAPPTSTTPDSSNTTMVTTPPANGIFHPTASNWDVAGDSGLICNDNDEEVFGSPIMLASISKSAEVTDAKLDMRLIVEVLVVRKMSMEEGFLDFEGFSFL